MRSVGYDEPREAEAETLECAKFTNWGRIKDAVQNGRCTSGGYSKSTSRPAHCSYESRSSLPQK